MRPLPRVALVMALLLTAVMLACGEETPPTAGITSPPVSPATGTPSATTTIGLTAVATFTGVRGPIEATPSPGLPLGGALLVDIRAAQHEGFDRIVFEFQGGLPGYRIEYAQPPILADASGEPIPIAGSAFLRVRFEPAAAHDPNTGTRTYTGPLDLTPGLPSLLEAKQTGDFEGVLTWVLGLTQQADFMPYQLRDPFRIVIDVAHP